MTEVNTLKESIYHTWMNLIDNLPTILLALIVFAVGLFLIQLINKYTSKIVVSKANDPLVADFILSIISLVLTVLLFVICLGILGFDDISTKILAAAGLSTFIIGFALKDIGENFLAGILMAFSRPFRIGDLIRIGNVKGRVIEMNLRSTTIKTLDGIDAYIPNASILKNNLENFTIDELMRNDFKVSIVHDARTAAGIQLLENVLSKEEFVIKIPEYSVLIDAIENDIVSITVYYWYKTDEVRAPGGKLKSDLQLVAYNALKSNGFKLPTTTVSYERIDAN